MESPVRDIGSIDSPDPTYGYLGGSQLVREKADYDINNDWIQNDLDGMIYVER